MPKYSILRHIFLCFICGVCTCVLAGIMACSDDFMAKSLSDNPQASLQEVSADAGGAVSGSMSASSTTMQVMRVGAGSIISGSSMAIPPGALAIDVDISIAPGEELVSDAAAQQLGITSGVQVAGPSVSFMPSTPIEATQPFTLALPLTSGSALALTTAALDYAVMYKSMSVSNGESSYYVGIIPRSGLNINGSTVSFQTTQFGVFQVVKAAVSEAVKVQSFDPVVPKQSLTNPLVGIWKGVCTAKGNPAKNKSNNGSTNTSTNTSTDNEDSDWPGYIDASIDNFYKMEGVKFTSSSFVYYKEIYTAKDCSGSWYVREVYTGTYALGDSLANGAKPLDIHMKSSAHAIGERAGLSYANQNRLCGLGDWQLSVAKDVTGTSCADKNDDESYDLVKVEAGELYFGMQDNDSNNGRTSEQRPTEIDTSSPLNRVE